MDQLFTWIYTNQTTSWLVCSWSTFGAWTDHEHANKFLWFYCVLSHTRIHKIHHDPDLGEAITFPLSVFSMPGHKGYIQMSFCPGTLRKFLNLRLSPLWRPIISCAHIWLKWGLKKVVGLVESFLAICGTPPTHK